jgi:glycosyltransferase involved in cell wall biosynthesis
MQFYKDSKILEFFDVSIIIPVTGGISNLKRSLLKNQQFFQRAGIQLILCLTKKVRKKTLLDNAQLYPFINWVIVVDEDKDINIYRALNKGIEQATNTYVLLFNSTQDFYTDIIYQLRYILEYYKDSYAVAASPNTSRNVNNNQSIESCIMVSKIALTEVKGYDEGLATMGTTDLQIRLTIYGLKKIILPDAITIGNNHRKVSNLKFENEKFYTTFINRLRSPKTTDKDLHLQRHITLYDLKSCRQNQLLEYLKIFEDYWISPNFSSVKNLKIVALIQVKNEKDHLPEVLLHLDNYCDGIILLDDWSSDNSFELAQSEKLLLKVRKADNVYYDNLQIRNTLLQLAYFIDSEWLFFTDADERFAADPYLFKQLCKIEHADSIIFRLVHLWDSPELFRRDLPEGFNGVLLRFRMFRHKGYMQIGASQEIHFPDTPITKKSFISNILIKHLGLMTSQIRRIKYDRYIKQDPDGKKQGYNYNYLLTKNPDLRHLKQILPKKISFDFAVVENKIIVIVPLRNAAPFISQCFNSLISQNYKNYQIFFIDDCSTDGSLDNIPGKNSRVEKIKAEERSFALKNIYAAIVKSKAQPDDIIMIVDGDDYLIHDGVFNYINRVYQQTNCLLSYGQYCTLEGIHGHCYAYTETEFRDLRAATWRASHLKTFKYKLYQEFLNQDPAINAYKDDNECFFTMTYDIALMIPLLEIAGLKRVFFNEEVLYVYRLHNFNDHNINRAKQMECENQIRKKPRFNSYNETS